MNTDELLNKKQTIPIFNPKQLFREITGNDNNFDEEALEDNE